MSKCNDIKLKTFAQPKNQQSERATYEIQENICKPYI